ncbi:hypothetical protein ACFX2C_039719 [Malus domestica]
MIRKQLGRDQKGYFLHPKFPTVNWRKLAKMGYVNDLAVEEFAEGSGATRALLANYSQTPRRGITPSRTPHLVSSVHFLLI